MKIAITGINGFLGSHVADYFTSKHQVFGISTSANQTQNFPVFRYDQLHAIDAPDVIVHCHAAVASGKTFPNNQTLFEGNVSSTEKVIAAFPNCKHLYVSSVSIYENQGKPISEDAAIRPTSSYAISKYWGEITALKAEKSIVLRMSSLFGNGMKEDTLIPNYCNQAIQNRQIEVWGTGARKQNYCHVADAVQIIDAIVAKDVWTSQIYLGVSSQEYANIEIAKIIAQETGATIVNLNQDNSQSVHYDNSFTINSLNLQQNSNIKGNIKSYIEWKKRQF